MGYKDQRQTPICYKKKKKGIVRVKAENNCLAHALIIAIVKLTDDSNYKSYRDGYQLDPLVHQLL